MENFCVYKHTTPSNKVYIGITSMQPYKRWKGGHGYQNNTHFYNAIKKYGWNNIKHEVLFSGLTKEEACQKEIELISEYNSADIEHGYNQSTGGEYGSSGWHPSDETIKKQRDSHIGKYAGENNPFYGKHHSEESKAKMSASHTGRGKPLSEEHKKKIGEANKGRVMSAESRRKMSEQRKGKAAKNKKRVMCVNNGVVYDSLTEAAIQTGANRKHISAVCKGARNTTRGLKFQYI